MTTASLRLSPTQKKRAKDIFSSPIASAAAIVIAVLWTIPTFSLLDDLDSSREGHQHLRMVDIFHQPERVLRELREGLVRRNRSQTRHCSSTSSTALLSRFPP